jgi:uncharacterized protein
MQMVERSWGSPCSVRRASRPNRISCGFDSKWCERSRRRPTRLSLPDSAVRGVRSALREHGIRDAAVEGSRLDLKSAYEYVDGGRTFVGYQCQAALAIESIGLDDVEALLIDVVAAGANELEAVGFDVRAKRELRARARREAVTAARAKAELYAEAAGIRVGAVLHIEDVDPEQPSASRYRSHAEAAAGAARDLAQDTSSSRPP